MSVTTESVTQVEAVYGCVGLLADSVSSLPIRVLDRPATVNTAKELVLPEWLERPYELISLTDWIVGFVWALALRGNYFGQIVERENGYPTQIMPVNPDIVRPQVEANGEVHWYFAGKPIPDDDVFHVRYQSMPGHLLGLNPIQCMRYPFGIAHVLDVHAEKFFANYALPVGVIQSKKELNPAASLKMAADWKSKFGGVNQSSTPAFLDNESEFKPIMLNPADQQLLESRKYSAESIAGMVFRIPPHMVGLNERSTSFGRGIEQQERTFVTNTLSGYLTRISRSLTECLPKGQYVDFDIRHRIRGDSLQRAEVAYKMILSGAWCGDDARETFDMPPAPEGQGKIFHSPTNSELLEMQLEELKKAEQEPSEDEKATKEAEAQAAQPQFPPAKKNGKGNPKQVALK